MMQDFPLSSSMWNFDPLTLIGGFLILAVYLGVMGIYRPRFLPSQPLNGSAMFCFLSSLLIAIFLQISPIDALTDKYLLLAHMVFHLTISNVIAPLLVLGLPAWWFTSILKIPFWKKTGRFLTNPVLTFALFNINLLMWHYPPFYEAALASESIHFLEHAAFLVSGVLFWWPVLSPTPDLPRLPSSYQILYFFLASVPCTVLGVIFVFSPTVLYATYANAPRIINVDPNLDQVLSGVLMTTLDNFYFLGALTIVFLRWLNQENVKSAVNQNT